MTFSGRAFEEQLSIPISTSTPIKIMGNTSEKADKKKTKDKKETSKRERGRNYKDCTKAKQRPKSTHDVPRIKSPYDIYKGRKKRVQKGLVVKKLA